MDHTLDMLAGGYAWLPGLLRRADGAPARTRVMGRPAVALRGPEAARFFYDERHVTRAGALPEPIRATLTGKGTVHGLDGAAHRARKAMFLALLADPGHVADLVREVGESWDDEPPAGRPGRGSCCSTRRAAPSPRACADGPECPWTTSTPSRPTWSPWSTGSARPAPATGGAAGRGCAGRPGWPTSSPTTTARRPGCWPGTSPATATPTASP
ncbi:cytochrome P450 family protein [Herbidospora solisilvae]|uniref:hypothetical protein n=1 Tax=Herbidospora solisilvae TaxID=2696284 RepID=UPI001F298208|nr:hypothetical protein [Herbidospora solisilvae]